MSHSEAKPKNLLRLFYKNVSISFMTGYVYILSSRKDGPLYTGVTTDLIRRIYEHKSGMMDGFTKKYNIKKLVYFETIDDIRDAIVREKQIKGMIRKKKIGLIEKDNPNWNDLYNIIIS